MQFGGLKRLFTGHGADDDGVSPRGIEGGSGRRFGRMGGRFDDESTMSTMTLAARGTQAFCLLIALFIAIAIAAFQRSNDVGPSGLTGLNLFIIVQALLVTACFTVVPILYERYGWLKAIAQVMRQVRVGLISHIIETVLLLIMALVNTISANTAGCKNPADDPNASVEGYIDKLPGFCRNKRALTAFYWLALVAWAVSTVVIVRRFHAVRRSATRIPPFVPPQGPHDAEFEAGEPDEAYDPAPPMSYANGPASRPSGTYYSADRPFDESIPAPTGYAAAARPDPFRNPPTYADPYARDEEDPYDRIRRSFALRDGDQLADGPRSSSTAPQIPPINCSSAPQHDSYR